MAYSDDPEVVPGQHFGHGDEGLQVEQPGKEVVQEVVQPETHGYYAPLYSKKDGDFEEKTFMSPRICGLTKRAFIIAIIVAVLVIIAAVGGAVGGALGKSKKATTQNIPGSTSSANPQTITTQNPTTTTSSSSESPATTTVTSIISVATDMAGCPLVNGTTFTAPSGDVFLKICYYDILSSPISNNIRETGGVTSFDSCIGLCDSYNTEEGESACKALVWDIGTNDYQDCWLKNTTNYLTSNVVTNNPNMTVCAILQ